MATYGSDELIQPKEPEKKKKWWDDEKKEKAKSAIRKWAASPSKDREDKEGEEGDDGEPEFLGGTTEGKKQAWLDKPYASKKDREKATYGDWKV